MLIHNMKSVQDVVKAWKNVARAIYTVNEEAANRIKLKDYANDDERRKLHMLLDIINEVIDWRMFFKLECWDSRDWDSWNWDETEWED